MLNAEKIAANRRNALRSTGPRTVAGSRASSMNATRHGLSATRVVVIQGVENEAEYEALVADVIADLKPQGAVESLLAERVAVIFWRLRRVLRFETESLSQQASEATSLAEPFRRSSGEGHSASGFVLLLVTSSCYAKSRSLTLRRQQPFSRRLQPA